LNLKNLKTTGNFFAKQMRVFDVGYINFGSEKGEFIGVERLDNGKLSIVENLPTSRNTFLYTTDSQGKRSKLSKILSQPGTFKSENWYTDAVKAGRPLWSKIYQWYDKPEILSISSSYPIYDSNRKLIGVIGVDLILSNINRFLQDLKISKSGQVFIIERDGFLVASSTKDLPFMIKNKQAQRMKASQSQNPLIRTSYQYLTRHFQNLKQIKNPQQLEFYLEGKRQFIAVTPWQDQFGLDWLIVVVVPEADFMEQINANTHTTIFLCLAALVIAILVGLLTARWIIHPILRLKYAATALSEGQFDQIINLNRNDELGVLEKSFNRMAQQLQESFTTLANKNVELQRLDELKDEFLANTSHELRTPLNGIIGIAESLIDGATGKLSEKTIANLAMIISSGRRLSHLVNDILDFSKLRHHNIQLKIQPIGIREIVDVVITISQPLVGKKLLKLINAISPDIPAVDADENRLQQILYNLIGNAIKFTDSGVVEVSARIIESCKGNCGSSCVLITVSDTGIGIPPNKLERIFESFEQADGSTAREYGGTGLGLTITKQLVELHEGKIFVSSTVGVGSKFSFTLQISQKQLAKLTPQCPILINQINPLSIIDSLITNSPENSNLNLDLIKNSKFKILIVDDEPINLQVLVNNLSLENYAITQATNGIEALEIIKNGFQPDLVLLDVMMPRMTGYEVAQKLRETFLPSELPIVMLTAKNQTSDVVEGFSSGANDYLTKPFSKNELLARIKTHIQLAKINAAYGRFVPHDFLKYLGHESIVDVKLGDHIQKEMTILFSDIRSFTTISEQMTPQQNFAFINGYLGRVSPLIRKHHGFIDKYIGDAVMALFPESPETALQAAIEMQKQVLIYNGHRGNSGYVPIAIGVGLHTGTLMLGTIGEQERMESTVISDAVNLASRLEGLTKVYGVGILISQQALTKVENMENYSYRFLDRVLVKGKTSEVPVFEVFDGDPELIQELKRKTRTTFEEGVILYYQQKFAQAAAVFQKVFQINPADKAAMLYLKRCKKLPKYGITDQW